MPASENSIKPDCEHNNQQPDRKRKTWVCADCGADTVPFYTEAERKQIAADDAKWNANLKRIVTTTR